MTTGLLSPLKRANSDREMGPWFRTSESKAAIVFPIVLRVHSIAAHSSSPLLVILTYLLESFSALIKDPPVYFAIGNRNLRTGWVVPQSLANSGKDFQLIQRTIMHIISMEVLQLAVKLAVIYYSSTGTNYKLAKKAAETAEALGRGKAA